MGFCDDQITHLYTRVTVLQVMQGRIVSVFS